MPLPPVQKPEEMSPETRSNCRACYDIQDLYWEYEKTDDPKRRAEIDRDLVDYLLKLSESEVVFNEVQFTELETMRLKKCRSLTDTMRRKLRIFCADLTREINGT
jgi:hypothetical protein